MPWNMLERGRDPDRAYTESGGTPHSPGVQRSVQSEADMAKSSARWRAILLSACFVLGVSVSQGAGLPRSAGGFRIRRGAPRLDRLRRRHARRDRRTFQTRRQEPALDVGQARGVDHLDLPRSVQRRQDRREFQLLVIQRGGGAEDSPGRVPGRQEPAGQEVLVADQLSGDGDPWGPRTTRCLRTWKRCIVSWEFASTRPRG